MAKKKSKKPDKDDPKSGKKGAKKGDKKSVDLPAKITEDAAGKLAQSNFVSVGIGCAQHS